MKMANMDSAFDFMFTSPKDDKGVSFILNLVFNTLISAEQGQCSHCLQWQ